MIVIEMNPRVSRPRALGLQGNRLPDRQDRRQAGCRLHPGRGRQRHHPCHAGLFRAGAGLRGGQDAALRLREVPGRRPGADHPHEVRRRGDGHRSQLHRGAGQGDALDGDQGGRILDRGLRRSRSCARSRSCWASPRWPPTAGCTRSRRRCGPAQRSTRWPRRPASIPGSSISSPRSWPSAPRWPTPTASRRALLRRAKRHGLSDRQIAALRPELSGEDGVRRLRHRAGIRPVYKTVDTCAAEFAASTPVPLLQL